MSHSKLLVTVAALVLIAASSCAWSASVTRISTGANYTLALKSDGNVWAWGDNVDGQLGDGTTADKSSPFQVPGISGTVAITAGLYHTVIVKNGGSVWTCGYNNYGQLGNGSRDYVTHPTPAQVSGISDVAGVTAGQYHSLATKTDGSVWAWGYNAYGQLGDGTTVSKTSPVQITSLSGIDAIAAGYNHSLAVVKIDGTVRAWGNNAHGQIGDGSTLNKVAPVQVTGLSGMTAVAAGYTHSLALKSDGTVWTWGSNDAGQLGDNTQTDRKIPIQVPGLSHVVAIAAGYSHSIAIKDDGSVWAWGSNDSGQLGDGTTTDRHVPTQIPNFFGVVEVEAGDYHTVARKTDGSVWSWGANFSGQLGDGTTNDSYTPVCVINGTTIAPTGSISINTGAQFTKTRSVALTLSATSPSETVSEMRISEDGTFDTEPWQTYQTSLNWTLADGDGEKSVYVTFRGPSGVESPTVSDKITLDSTPPSIGTITLTPTMVASGDTVHIEVSSTDASSGVASVTADGVSLTSIGGNMWSGNIIAASGLGSHSTNVVATDAAGNSQPSTAGSYTTAAIIGVAGKGLVDPLMTIASNRWLFRVWGKVTIVDSDRFDLDNGSGTIVRVTATGYSGIANGDYVCARGLLNVTTVPIALASDPSKVNKLH